LFYKSKMILKVTKCTRGERVIGEDFIRDCSIFLSLVKTVLHPRFAKVE